MSLALVREEALPASASAFQAVAALRDDLANSANTLKGAALVGYSSLTAYAGATVGRALRDMGRVLQGADPTGATDSTAALRQFLDACIPVGAEAVLPGGNYTISGPISNPAQIAAGALHIRCVGDVTITVDAGATAFDAVLSCYTTAINSATISGGRLTLNLSNKAAIGLLIRHAGTDGGTVDLGPVTVLNAKKLAGDSNENGGIIVLGRYSAVTMRAPIVDTVDRTATGGACKGISISDVVGPVVLDAPQVSRVLCTGFSSDADGIAVFGRELAGTYANRAGSLLINAPVITDCQGRSIKTQISQSTIIAPVIKRQMVVAFATNDIDHQMGGVHDVIGATMEYRKNGATSPVTVGFRPIMLQQQCTDRPNRMRVVGGVLRSEIDFPQLAYVIVGASALTGEVEVSDVEVQALGTFTTAAFTRAVVEFSAGEVQASTGNTHITLRGVRGNFSGIPLLGYTAASAANTSKLSWEVVGNENTGADAAGSVVFAKLSGVTTINQVGRFMMAANTGFADFLGAWVFDYLTLRAGCTFTYDRGASTASNAPVLTGLYPRVEALGSISNGNRDVRIMEDTGAALKVWFRQSATWRNV